MDNFIFHNPTRLIFGKGMIAQLSQQIPADKRIMITFGGGSVKTNGVYEQVIQALEGRDYTEFWGIESNPDISTLKKAIESGKEKNIDFLLAVGGGSVIDGTKLISAGIPYDGDAWELVKKGSAQNTIPLGTVLTIPATGSEMNNGAVISCRETHEKYPFFSSHPVFSILDPTVTFSLPDYQIACGLADTFVHVTTHLQVQLLLLSLHQLNNQEYERCNLFTCFYLRPRLQEADQRIKGICPIYGHRDNPCL